MKNLIKIFLILLISIFIAGCFKEDNETRLLREIDEQIKEMSLREKIAQMLIVYNNTSNISDDYLQELRDNQIGGFILFDNNMSTYHDTKQLILKIKETSRIPMFIAVDQEGGNVQRLNKIQNPKATNIPDMVKIGNKDDSNLSYAVGTIIGEETRSLGINTVFAPVLDIGDYKNSPLKKRIISNDKDKVSNHGIKLAEGIKDSGVIPVYKHFPGIGSTKVDSHQKLPIIDKSLDDLYSNDLIPFKKAIENDYYKAEMIMIAHANYPKISNNSLPASLSKEIINDLLRNELGFQGVVVTDALNMKALTNNYTESEIFALGINATIDIFLMPSKISESISIIENLVQEQKVSEETINNSVKRILLLKRKCLDSFTSLDSLYFGSNEHKTIVSNIK